MKHQFNRTLHIITPMANFQNSPSPPPITLRLTTSLYVCPFDGVRLHYVQWTPLTPIQFPICGIRLWDSVFFQTYNFCPQRKHLTSLVSDRLDYLAVHTVSLNVQGHSICYRTLSLLVSTNLSEYLTFNRGFRLHGDGDNQITRFTNLGLLRQWDFGISEISGKSIWKTRFFGVSQNTEF